MHLGIESNLIGPSRGSGKEQPCNHPDSSISFKETRSRGLTLKMDLMSRRHDLETCSGSLIQHSFMAFFNLKCL